MRMNDPPEIHGYRLDTSMPLHQLAVKRMKQGRDLKIIITAEHSQTGVGKTTGAGWLALSWTKMFAGHDWFVKPDNPIDGMGTLNPKEYFQIIGKVGHGKQFNPGTVVMVDDAEELDARRAMQHLNVDFSQRWMLMRLKQAITIITLPSPAAIDSRLEELADIWINIEVRGRGLVHDIRVNSYGRRNVMTEQKHKIEFPDISAHPELEKLRQMKEDKMDEWDKAEEEEEVNPEEVKQEEKRKNARRMRKNGITVETIAESVAMSTGWVSTHTKDVVEG